MQDKITKLCNKLVRARQIEDVYPVSEQLQAAIHDVLERVREDAMGVLMIDRVVDHNGLLEAQREERPT
jgi:hypothetical protein